MTNDVSDPLGHMSLDGKRLSATLWELYLQADKAVGWPACDEWRRMHDIAVDLEAKVEDTADADAAECALGEVAAALRIDDPADMSAWHTTIVSAADKIASLAESLANVDDTIVSDDRFVPDILGDVDKALAGLLLSRDDLDARCEGLKDRNVELSGQLQIAREFVTSCMQSVEVWRAGQESIRADYYERVKEELGL